MVIETLLGGSIAALTIYAASNWQADDKKKIQHVFNNLDYKINDRNPKLIKTHKTDLYTTYTYSVPYGLVDDDKLNVLEKVLNKPVKISFENQKLHIKVYNQKLDKSYPYNDFSSKGGWSIPVGMSQDGIKYHDFEQIPHMIVSGSTTWGKTVFMRMFMAHLIENNPEGVEFYVLDLKGGLAFNRYHNLKQVKAVAKDHRESARVLKMVKRDIKRDIDYLLSIDAENAAEGGIKTRKFIIIDEAGELKPEKSMSDSDKEYANECQGVMSYIARVAGQVGYKMIFGTQYPTKEILDSQIKANALARVSFRLATAIQSGVAIDQTGAEKLEYKGRAIYKTVDEHLVQTPFISKDEIWERIGRYNENVSAATETTSARRIDTLDIG